MNVATTHKKGHQNMDGKIFANGQYYSKFLPHRYSPRWHQKIQAEIVRLNKDLERALEHRVLENAQEIISDHDAFLKIHSHNMHELLDRIGSPEEFLSHSTCFCCLMQSPQHSLPCGHVVCSACVRYYGKPLGSNSISKDTFQLTNCPLHPYTTTWPRPHVVRFKPDHAGVRLLCLDG